MSGDGRGFREVDIAITSVQPGAERLGRSDDPALYPAWWRNNLTALSQYANLYFVGVLDEIHVYQPSFPSQHLGKRIFAWRVATSGVVRRGFICPNKPHWINRLVVGDYGTEEVLATAHDEGDFIVCTVRSVCRAIAAARIPGVKDQEVADRCIKYMCRKNVELSAWGVAIHANARLLAVSSNTKNITVLAPALIRHDASPGAPSNVTERTGDKVFLLSGHEANIPALSFCNTIDDPDGRFLVSTDISGAIIIWDIWKQCGLKRIAMSLGPDDAYLLRENFLGWSVACVDSRSFRSARTDVEFVGFTRPPNKMGVSPIDVSPARKHLRDFQFWHGRVPPRMRARDSFLRSQRDEPSSTSDESDDSEAEELIEELIEDIVEQHVEFDDDFEAPDAFDGLDGLDAWDDPDEPDQSADYDAIDFGPAPAARAASPPSDDALAGPVPVRRLALTQPFPPLARTRRFLPTAHVPPPFAPYSQRRNRAPPSAPKAPTAHFPFAILHSGQRIVTLLRPPFDAAAAVCIDPCHEHLPPMIERTLENFERLNLTAYIPALGIAVLATQKGRAAIFSLTSMPGWKHKAGARDAASASRLRTRRRSSSNSGISANETDDVRRAGPARHAFRLDWVVPFKSQENAEQRPWTPLMGIATAPVQGCNPWHGVAFERTPASATRDPTNVDPERDGLDDTDGEGWDASGRGISTAVLPASTLLAAARFESGASHRARHSAAGRWRLLLTYADHTVLSYELFRAETADGGGDLVLI